MEQSVEKNAEMCQKGSVKSRPSVQAVLRCVTAPDEKQLEKIRSFAASKCGSDEIHLECIQDPSLGGGFVLTIGDKEYDWSTSGRISQMKEQLGNISGNTQGLKGIISILKSKIEDFDLKAKESEVGTVNWVGDGIANIEGIDHAMYGEIVVFDNGVKGMVQDIRRDEVA